MVTPSIHTHSVEKGKLKGLQQLKFAGKYMKWVLLIILISAGLVWYIAPSIRKNFAANPGVSVTLTPSKPTVYEGQPLSLAVQMTGQKLMALDLMLTYDGALVSYPAEIAGQSGYTKLSQDSFQAPIKEEVLPGEGTNKKLHLVITTQTANVSDIKDALLFNLAFTVKSPGAANFIINAETKVTGMVISEGRNQPTYFDLTPTQANTTVTIPPCPSFSQGNATCDTGGVIDLSDFTCWKSIFLMEGEEVPGCPKGADFNTSGAIDIFDFTIWQISFVG